MGRLLRMALLVLALGFSTALSADTGTATAGSSAVFAEATKAKRITDPPPQVVVGVLEDALDGSCSLHATDESGGRKGVKGTFDAVVIDANTGTMISDLGRKKGKTNKEGLLTVDFPVPRIANFAVQAAMVVGLNLGGGKKITQFEFSCQLVDDTL